MNMKGNVKKTLLIVVLIAIFLAILSCEDDNMVDTNGNNEESNETKDVIVPLTVGNYWTYLVVSNYGTPDTLKMEITKQIPVTYAGETLVTSARTFYPKGGARPDYDWLFWNGTNGLYIVGGISSTDTFVIKNLELKFPAEVGESWPVPNVRYSLSDERFYISDTLAYSLVAKDEEFETPAGNFKCHVYKFSEKPADDVSEFWDYYYYYFPGIGLVGLVVKGQDDGRILSRLLLLSYDVK